jgi:hypothetical protein
MAAMKSIILGLLALSSPGAVGQTPSLSETVLVNCSAPVTFLRFSPDRRELVRVCGAAFRGPKMAALFDTGTYNKARTSRKAFGWSPTTRLDRGNGDGARVWDSTLLGAGFHRRHHGAAPSRYQPGSSWRNM